jgi:hypothetical protein
MQTELDHLINKLLHKILLLMNENKLSEGILIKEFIKFKRELKEVLKCF